MNAVEKPDFIVMQNMKSTAIDVIQTAETKGVEVFLFNSGLSDKELAVHGGPRQSFANWIGQILPDDASAGYLQAQHLVDSAINRGLVDAQGKVQLLALGGTVSDTSAIEREKGLRQYVADFPNKVALIRNQVFPANWDQASAYSVFTNAFSVFPQVNAVWNANDNMAIGVIQALSAEFPQQAGSDLLIGGIDWTSEALAAIEEGAMELSIGGHFAECIWAMVVLYDYSQGIDFEKSEGSALRSSFSVLNQNNLQQYTSVLDARSAGGLAQLDYAAFTKAENPSRLSYNFSLKGLLE
jgi:ABC-type sugar transport system substrate-binding protein